MKFWRIVDPQLFDTVPLVAHHHHALHLVAISLAILASWVFLPIVERFNATSKSHQTGWLFAGSVSMGLGIWAMHFTAMLAYHVETIIIEYNVLITGLSILPAILGAGTCILLAQQATLSMKYLIISAVCLALGIGSMHYLGMEAIISHGADMYYIPSYFFISLLAVTVLAFIGLYFHFHITQFGLFFQKYSRTISSIILGLSVSAMHFIAMEATYFHANNEYDFGATPEIPLGLIVGVITATVIILGFVIFVSTLDKQLSSISKSLIESEEKFQRLAETTHVAIFTVSRDAITYANPALSVITGYNQKVLLSMQPKTLFGKKFQHYLDKIYLSDDDSEAFHKVFKVKTSEENSRWLYFNLTTISFNNNKHILASAFDITEQKEAELELSKLAYSDQLTNLPNRTKLLQKFNDHIALRQELESPPPSWVLLLDLDNFKSINDTNGHLYGDRLLMEIASRLLFLKKQHDVVARLGGDEFILLLNDINRNRNIEHIANEIINSITRPYQFAQRVIHIGCSIGILELNQSYTQPDQILHDVDVALYRAKQQQLSAWVKFDAEQDAQTKRDRMLLPELKQALLNDEIEFYYQPIVDATNYQCVGFEALARWQRHNGEFVSPGEFIPLAEKSGLIADIGLLGIRSVCEQVVRWREQHVFAKNLYVSVNIASLSMNDDRFLQTVKSLLSRHEIPHGQIKLELTERMLVEDFDTIVPKLNQLIELGCEIMIDDFGTGYSSLSYLHLLPVSTLKIDRSFVIKLDEEHGTEPVVKTITALAKTLKLNVISEGVETLAQANQLADLESTHLQGYYFAKPMPANMIKDYLDQTLNE